MEIGQLNITADQVAPERLKNGGSSSPVETPGRSDSQERKGRSTEELGRALAAEISGPDIQAPNELRLRVEEDLNFVVAKIVNSETEEVVREVPPEELVSAAKKLNAILGQMLDREV